MRRDIVVVGLIGGFVRNWVVIEGCEVEDWMFDFEIDNFHSSF